MKYLAILFVSAFCFFSLEGCTSSQTTATQGALDQVNAQLSTLRQTAESQQQAANVAAESARQALVAAQAAGDAAASAKAQADLNAANKALSVDNKALSAIGKASTAGDLISNATKVASGDQSAANATIATAAALVPGPYTSLIAAGALGLLNIFQGLSNSKLKDQQTQLTSTVQQIADTVPGGSVIKSPEARAVMLNELDDATFDKLHSDLGIKA